MSSKASMDPELPDALLWLKDAPLFIDADQVARFYDAVVRPSSEEGARTITVSDDMQLYVIPHLWSSPSAWLVTPVPRRASN
jgi:hypothetical protein